ncbi:ataxin-10 [Culicoides brevitarsis]|uniref:ataxin-10 n=1 Tax=Culicoides brevitarsis TaxID=469753 RepID=UPI00307BA89B
METQLEKLQSFQPVSQKTPEEIPSIIAAVLEIISSVPLTDLTADNEKFPAQSGLVLEAFKILKGVCPKGKHFQQSLLESKELLSVIQHILSLELSQELHLLRLSTVQLLFNMSVGDNTYKIFNKFRETFVEGLNPDVASRVSETDHAKYCNTVALMLFNIVSRADYAEELLESGELLRILEYSLRHTLNDEMLPDNVQLLLNTFATALPETATIYEQLSDELRLQFLYYIHDTMKEEEICEELLNKLILRFKQTSDSILKPDGTGADKSRPKEVYCLLEIISVASQSENEMKETVSLDGSLFLNIGCLLMSIQKLGKDPNSIFAPVQKLEALAPNSTAPNTIESEISYKFKSLLVQTIANLLYKNKKNQELVREMDILIAVLDCTNIDARNPLLKEYSIWAIRNACENNPENQQFIASLTKIGKVKSEIVSEISEGVLRIQK